MNIYLMFVLLGLLEDVAVLPTGRGELRHQRNRVIAHNRRVYRDVVGPGIWFENQNANYEYVGYHRGQVTNKPQQGRWATTRLSGHRRFEKWCRDYYPSGKDEAARRRWDEELKEFFES